MENHTEANVILLPGKIPGYKRDDFKLLPYDTSKKVSVLTWTYAVYITVLLYLKDTWKIYKTCCEQTNFRVLVYSTFCSHWRQLLPHVVITKPQVFVGNASKTPQPSQTQLKISWKINLM